MNLEIDVLKESDLDEADRVFRLAFQTFLGLPDPASAFGDSDPVRTRWRAGNTRTIAAHRGRELVGSNILTRWGSVGWFGPMTVRPDLWDQGIARALLESTTRVFEEWRVTHRGLFTFAHSPKHLSLYSRYGFSPRFLTYIGEKTLPSDPPAPKATGLMIRLSEVDESRVVETLTECAELTGGLFPGLDLNDEIRSVRDQRLGETLLLKEDSRVEGFAVCQAGAGSEAGSGRAYIKFAAVRPGQDSLRRLSILLSEIERYAISRGAAHVEAGTNSIHRETWRLMRERGYKIQFVGVAMHSPDDPGYHRPELYVIDDWR
jgi:GNAT superfamily N-acetyltransferase